MGAVLITGGTGFLGLAVAEALLARGEEVVLLALSPLPEAAERAFAALPGRLHLVPGDVRQPATLRRAFAAAAVDRLLPLAAITAGPEREATDPEEVVAVNVQGLIATLRAARLAKGVRRVVIPSSSAVYGESAYTHPVLDEASTPCVPLSLYGATKYAAERIGLRLCERWGLDAVAARIGPAFGPWEHPSGWRDTLSPFLQLLLAADAGQEAVLPPAPLPAYEWIYVRDVVAGLLCLLNSPVPPHRVVNLGAGRDGSGLLPAWCEALAARFPGFRWRHAAAGEKPTIRLHDTRPRGVLAIARAAAFGWAPQTAPETAIADFLAWAERHPLPWQGG